VGRKETLGRPSRRWEDNKLELQVVGWRGGGADWIDLAPEKEKWRALVNAVMNFTFVDPCITAQFIKKIPKRCNSVSKCYYSIFI
jgi:hypothetical protein